MSYGGSPGWTEAEDQRLRELWAQRPLLSGREIGVVMGKSKGAVVGRAHRTKLPPRPSPVAAQVSAAWTDDLNLRLRAAWVAGQMSGAAIGHMFNLSESQLAAQVKYLDLPPRRAPRGGAAEVMAARFAAAGPRAVVPRRDLPLAAAHRQCQWIEGESRRGAFAFCGAPTGGASSYCAQHHARCFHPRLAA